METSLVGEAAPTRFVFGRGLSDSRGRALGRRVGGGVEERRRQVEHNMEEWHRLKVCASHGGIPRTISISLCWAGW